MLAGTLLAAPTTQPATRPAKLADLSPEVEAMLKPVAAAYANLKSLDASGNIVLSYQENGTLHNRATTFSSTYLAPAYYMHEAKDQPTLGSTGTKTYSIFKRTNIYTQEDAPKGKSFLSDLPEDHASILPMQNLSLVLALAKDPMTQLRSMAEFIQKAPDQQIDGKTYPAFEIVLAGSEDPATVAIDPKTHLIRKVTMDMSNALSKRGRGDVKSPQYVVDYTTVKPNAALTAEQFAWAPPAGAKDVAAAGDDAGGDEEQNPGLALIGKPAPDFTLKDKDGKDITLSDLKGSVVVLDFWATWCGPCVASMPSLQALHDSHKAQGLKVFAVDLRESKEKVEAFQKEKGLTIPVLFDAGGNVAKLYLVNGIPTKCIIGKDGTVKKYEVGFNPDGADELVKFIDQELQAKSDKK